MCCLNESEGVNLFELSATLHDCRPRLVQFYTQYNLKQKYGPPFRVTACTRQQRPMDTLWRCIM